MNRLWAQFFGIGLSKVLSDLGVQGEPPVNGPLLDWLACEFMDSGWDMRHMIRLIVTSDRKRRGLYTWWQRSFLHPSLLAFDAPSREECAAERTRSNIPQQALVLLNDPTYVEAAKSLAGRILGGGPGSTLPQRMAGAWQLALQRDPTAGELERMTALFMQHLADYQNDPDAALRLLKTGLAPVQEAIPPAELAAWTHVSRVLLNLHETITRD